MGVPAAFSYFECFILQTFPQWLLRRLVTVDVSAVAMVNLLQSIRGCVALMKARKVMYTVCSS